MDDTSFTYLSGVWGVPPRRLVQWAKLVSLCVDDADAAVFTYRLTAAIANAS